ncbi:MAG: cytochrome c oxidase subunit II [candidate division Zixibacteria bacterium]
MDSTGTLFLPPGSSTIAGDVDAVFNLILYVGIFFFVLVVGLAAFFVFRYRRTETPGLTSGKDHNLKLEILWTVIPSIIVVIFFVVGFRTFLKMNIIPKDAMEIKVTAQRWMWAFDYPEGANSINELVVPVNKPIKALLSSTDVIHSFFVPEFRIKMDVLPNRYTMTWFEATRVGEYDLLCAEYCGKGHSEMVAKVKVVDRGEYEAWLEKATAFDESIPLKEHGEKFFKTKACNTCHTNDGAGSVGPTFKGLFGHEVIFSDGSKLKVNENYIRESILDPRAKVVMGYQPVMPTYQGRIKDREIDALVAYIKSLSE